MLPLPKFCLTKRFLSTHFEKQMLSSPAVVRRDLDPPEAGGVAVYMVNLALCRLGHWLWCCQLFYWHPLACA